MPKTSQGKAYLFALISVLFWSTVASAFKIGLSMLPPITLVCYASLVSFLFLMAVIAGQSKLNLLLQSSLGDIAHSAWLGFLNPFGYYAVLFVAYSLLPAQEAQPLNFTWPIVLVLASMVVLKQKVPMVSLFAFIVSFIGVMVIATRGDLLSLNFSNPLGVALAVGSSLIWALYWIGNMRDDRDEVVKLALNFWFGTLYCIMAAVLLDQFRLPSMPALLSAVYIGLFEMGLTFVLWLKALKLSESTDKVAIFIYGIPFISMVFIYFILGEVIRMSSIAGAALIVLGILLQKWLGRKKKAPSAHNVTGV